MLSSYNLKNKQTIQISGLILQYCSATTLYRRLLAAGTKSLSRPHKYYTRQACHEGILPHNIQYLDIWSFDIFIHYFRAQYFTTFLITIICEVP